MNVVLTSSEHPFPFGLTKHLGFNTDNFNKYVYAGEVPPRYMYTLLTEEWQIEENIAIALMNHYGGHIYDTYLGLKLLTNREEFYCLR